MMAAGGNPPVATRQRHLGCYRMNTIYHLLINVLPASIASAKMRPLHGYSPSRRVSATRVSGEPPTSSLSHKISLRQVGFFRGATNTSEPFVASLAFVGIEETEFKKLNRY